MTLAARQPAVPPTADQDQRTFDLIERRVRELARGEGYGEVTVTVHQGRVAEVRVTRRERLEW